jgi:hypothetical protein
VLQPVGTHDEAAPVPDVAVVVPLVAPVPLVMRMAPPIPVELDVVVCPPVAGVPVAVGSTTTLPPQATRSAQGTRRERFMWLAYHALSSARKSCLPEPRRLAGRAHGLTLARVTDPSPEDSRRRPGAM